MSHKVSYYKYSLYDTLRFGKHKGKTVRWVIDNDIKWIKWALLNTRFDMNSLADEYYADMVEDDG